MAKNIGSSYPTKIPELTDNADIRQAMYLYHYGSFAGDTDIQQESVASYLGGLRTDVNSKISSKLIDAKGDLLVGAADDTVVALPTVPTDGFEYVLRIDSAQPSGLRWVMSGKDEERISHIMGVY
jgi:hypothetical protein